MHCFLWMKFARDVISLLAGGALLYAIIRWRHFILFPFVFPFARLETYTTFNGTKRKFVTRNWAETFGNGLAKSLVVIIFTIFGLAVTGAVGFELYLLGKWLWSLYYVC